MLRLLLSNPSSSSKIRSLLRSASTAAAASPLSPPGLLPLAAPQETSAAAEMDLDASQVAASFKEWFLEGSSPLSPLDRVYAALSSAPDDHSLDAALLALRLPLSEALILRVLRHRPHPAATPPSPDRRDLLLLRLRFFDWSGRQRRGGYRHTRAAYHAVFRLLSRARLASVVLDWLRRAPHGLHDTLVVGYSVAGRPELALALFARFRFQGLDLDPFSYHVLLNALLDAADFDSADAVLAQIHARRLASPVTYALRLKSLCLQGRLDAALAHLLRLPDPSGRAAAPLVQALCARARFEDAARLVDRLRAPHAFAAWVAALLSAGRLDHAFRFLKSDPSEDGFVPKSSHYNMLVARLLRRNQLADAYEALVVMREQGVPPDRLTMNAALCFFCKAGMVDVAVQLYNSRYELGLSPTRLVYDYLVAALCRGGAVEDACRILEEAARHGYFPGGRMLDAIATVLCREGKLDLLRDLLNAAIQRNVRPVASVFARYIAALCKAGEVEEACMVPQMVGGEGAASMDLGRYKYTYTSLINAFVADKRVDMLPRMIMEMQDDGHVPSRQLYREVVCCLCNMGCFSEVFNLLDKQLERKELDCQTCYNYFIDGSSRAKKPELAWEVYNRMVFSGITPNMDTNILMLQSYLKNRCIGDALNFFNSLREKREPSTKLYNIFISGLCEARKVEQAVAFWREVRDRGLIPSLQCYEELVLTLCSSGDYDTVVKILKDFRETGRPISSFLCNVLLFHTLKTRELLRAWVQSGDGNADLRSGGKSRDTSGSRLLLGPLIAAFSGGIRMESLESLDEVIEKFFPVDVFTYNMLLRGLSMVGRMDYACNLFHKMQKKGYEPNRWTFDTIVHGFCKQGKRKDAEMWMEEMYRNGFHLTSYTMSLYNNTP